LVSMRAKSRGGDRFSFPQFGQSMPLPPDMSQLRQA
jgi:hypothetical protein